jgi:hypothetical protein
VQRGQVLLVDTNIVIEAFRTGCWKALTTHFKVETVEKCYEEALTGDPLRPGYLSIGAAALRSGLSARHKVSEPQRVELSLRSPLAAVLDAGERDLLAHALGRGDAWIVSCADRAGVRAALELGWEERIVALDTLARAAGSRAQFKRHFTEAWLAEVRTAYKLEGRLK